MRELCANPQAITTHAITIDAPADTVWPWLVQISWGRWSVVHRSMDGSPLVSRRTVRAPTASSPSCNTSMSETGILDGAPETKCSFVVEQLEANRHVVLHSREHLPPGWG